MKKLEKTRLSYACWIFNEEEIVTIFENKEFLMINFESSYDEPYITGFGLLRYKSLFFKSNRIE